MDATQIMMMPAGAGSSQATGLPVVATDGALAGLFGRILGQNILGLQGLSGLEQNVVQPQPEVVLAPPTDSIVALTHEFAEQEIPSTESDPAVVNQLAAYAQLAVLQTNLPVQQLQQIPTATIEESTVFPMLEGVTAVQSGAKAVDADVAGALAVFAATIPADEAAVPGVADNKKESAGAQNGVQQEVIGHAAAVATAKLTATPNPAAVNSKFQAAVDASVNPIQQQDLAFNAESAKQVQKGQVSGQQTAQQTAEAQPVAQEVLGAVKATPTAVQQPVRFAQPPDVVAAAAGSEGQKNPASDQQNQGSQMTAKTPKELVMQGGQVKPELVENAGTTFRLPEQHAVPMHTGQPVVVATDGGATAELVKNVPQELVSRQVTDRLANHEIKQGSDQISLKLSPENLGNLQLNMRMDDNRLKLEIVAENRGVRDALLQQADDLKETLARQNIKVDSFNVTTGNGNNHPQQQSADWRQMAQEQRQYQSNYAAFRTKGGAVEEGGASMKYFVPQYQSTIDVKF